MGPKLLLLFIVGDILGTGVYALTGQVAGEVGGAAWAPFLVAFLVATITAFSYLELVTRYPQAAGAALYTHRAFGVHFLTFLVAFTVMCSGITSASTASNAFAGFVSDGFGLGFDAGSSGRLVLALGFMALVAAINFRGVGESVKANVVLTIVELSGLLMIIMVGFWAMSQGRADFTEVMIFQLDRGEVGLPGADRGDLARLLRHGRLRGLGQHGRGVQEPGPRLPADDADRPRDHRAHLRARLDLRRRARAGRRPRRHVQGLGADPGGAGRRAEPALRPHLPLHRHVRRRQLGAHQHADGEPAALRPRAAGRAAPRPRAGASGAADAVGGDPLHHRDRLRADLLRRPNSQAQAIALLGGTTALLLLCVFTIVNISLIVLRSQPVGHEHFRTPAILPYLGAASCAFLVGPWARSAAQMPQYRIAAWLLVIGIVLWACTWAWNRSVRHRPTALRHPDDLAEHPGDAPTN